MPEPPGTARATAGRLRMLLGWSALALAGFVTIAQAQGGVRGIDPDFATPYLAGRVVADGGSPYDQPALEARTNAGDRPLVFFYDAPPTAVVFRVLSVLPVRAASAVWMALSLAAVALIAAFTVRRDAPRLFWLALPCVLLLSPVRHTLALGQKDLVFFGLLVAAAWWQERAEDPSRAAAAVPLVILKPQIGALVAVTIGVRALAAAPRRAVLALLVGTALVLSVPAVLAPSAKWVDWVDHASGRGRGEARIAVLLGVLAVGALALGARTWRRAGGPGRPLDWLVVAGAANGLLAVVGHAWNPQWFVALALPLGALLVDVRAGRITLTGGQTGLLVVAVGLMAGNGTAAVVWNDGLITAGPPLASLGALLVGLWLLGEVNWGPAVGVIAVNVTITVAGLGPQQTPIVSVTASAILLYLVVATGAGAQAPSPVRPVGAR